MNKNLERLSFNCFNEMIKFILREHNSKLTNKDIDMIKIGWDAATKFMLNKKAKNMLREMK